MQVEIFSGSGRTVSDLPVEYVERKGLGHPDSICDAVMESAAQMLREEYVRRCDRVLHHNLDKALLVAGQSEPQFGGGKVVSPIQIIAGDRATSRFGDVSIPVNEIVEAAVLAWFDDNLRLVESDSHVQFRSEIKPGSAELTGIFDRPRPVANDTSAAVGYAPLSETERLVLSTERHVNSPDFKGRFPVSGEDVKVMGVRHGKRLRLTVAIAMVDRFVPSEASYYEQKEAIRSAVEHHARQQLQRLDDVTVDLNTLDDPSGGQAAMYLTVLGTSAESGDGGEVGRGNAVNGLISLNRPTSNEAAAGKNTVCHVGNIYNHLSHAIANEIVESIGPVRESYVWLCSQIGQPIDEPWSTSVCVSLEAGIKVDDVKEKINAIVQQNLQRAAQSFTTGNPSKI